MKFLVLTYFDPIEGPVLYFKAPESIEDERIDFLPSLMDLNEHGFFTHEHEDYNTANLTFELRSKGARGGVDGFMISLVLYNETISPRIFRDVLEDFVKELTQIKDVYKGIRVRDESDTEANRIADEIKTLFYDFFEDLPEETVLIDRNAQILVFGLKNAGKTTLVKNLRGNMLNNQKFKTDLKAKRLLFANLTITTYDMPIKRIFRELWGHYMDTQDGFVFVIDASDSTQLNAVKNELYLLQKIIEKRRLPLLIVFNKIDLEHLDIDSQINSLDLKKYDFPKYKCFETSAITNEGIFLAFNWIATKILNKIYREKYT